MNNFKLSKYNYFKKKKDIVVGLNLYNQNIFSISRENYDILMSYKSNLEKLKEDHQVLFSTMYKLGIIEDLDFDIPTILLMKNREQVFSSSTFRLFINPTLNCNFSCWYCYETHNKKKMDKRIIESIIKFVENLIIKERISNFHLDWFGGEPLLCYETVIKPICIEVKKLCIHYNINYYMSMTTNGFLITQPMILFFKEHNFRSFQITLDGNRAAHNKTRFFGKDKRGTFDIIVKNISFLIDMTKIRVALRINYTKETMANSVSIINEFPKEMRDRLTITLSQVWQDNLDNDDFESKLLLKKEFEMHNIFKKAGFNIRRVAFQSGKHYTCYADLKNEAVINYDGRVFKCTAVDFETAAEDGVLTDKGEIIWKDNIVGKRLARATFDDTQCLNCEFVPICTSNCSSKSNRKRLVNNECIAKLRFKKHISERMNRFHKTGYKICHISKID